PLHDALPILFEGQAAQWMHPPTSPQGAKLRDLPVRLSQPHVLLGRDAARNVGLVKSNSSAGPRPVPDPDRMLANSSTARVTRSVNAPTPSLLQSCGEAKTPVGRAKACRYANSGRMACSIASECRAVPPVAASSTGLPVNAFSSNTSTNNLNKPAYEPLYMGDTATSASAEVTWSMTCFRRGLANPAIAASVISRASSRNVIRSTEASGMACSMAWAKRSAGICAVD